MSDDTTIENQHFTSDDEFNSDFGNADFSDEGFSSVFNEHEQLEDKEVAQVKSIPHSVAAEQAVIGGLCLNNNAWDDASEVVSANDFFLKEHRDIFQVMEQMARESDPFDVLTIPTALEGLGLGGDDITAYLTELVNNTPSAANIKAYARIVRERAVLREMIGMGQKIADLGYNPGGRESAELVDEAERMVFQLAEGRQAAGGPQDMKTLLKKSVVKLDELFNSGTGLTGVSTGFTDLDAMTNGLQPSDMVVIAGRPSMGKTTFSMNIAEDIVLRTSKPVIVFSMEMPAEQLMLRMISSMGRIDQTRMRSGKLSEDDWPRINSAIQMFNDKKLYIDDNPALSPTEVRARARRIHREHGEMGLILIDYLQLMRVPGAESRVAEISEISRSMKALAKELNCPVIALSQLNRSLEQRPNKRPVMSDLRESGAIEHDADLIMFIYRDEVYHEDSMDKGIAEIIIGKQRNGPIGTCRLAFLGKYTRFEDLSPDYVHHGGGDE